MMLRCLRSDVHRTFKRVVIVQGPSAAVLDEHGDVVSYEDCREFRQVHSTSEVRCVACGEKPVITIA